MLVRSGFAFLFVFATLAAGHLLMVAINAADHTVSGGVYQRVGVEARWFGDRSLAEKLEGLTIPLDGELLHMLPVSPFLVVAAVGLFAVGVGLLVASRWVRSDALQSVIGVFAGLAIWTGAVEYGLMIGSRLLGVAKSVEVHGERVVGAFGEYVLLKHT